MLASGFCDEKTLKIHIFFYMKTLKKLKNGL
jgi:hypothetical protein